LIARLLLLIAWLYIKAFCLLAGDKFARGGAGARPACARGWSAVFAVFSAVFSAVELKKKEKTAKEKRSFYWSFY
jgi:hypothetical protein